MDNMKHDRSSRRSERQRLLTKWRARVRRMFGRWGVSFTDSEVEQSARHMLSAPKGCSCSMCRNPRKTYKGDAALTKQELIAELNEREERANLQLP